MLCSFLAICFTNVFLTNFQTFILVRTKVAVGDVTKLAITKKIALIDFLASNDVELISRVMPSFMWISARVHELFRKNRGGRDKPPGGQGLSHKINFNLSGHNNKNRKQKLEFFWKKSNLGKLKFLQNTWDIVILTVYNLLGLCWLLWVLKIPNRNVPKRKKYATFLKFTNCPRL